MTYWGEQTVLQGLVDRIATTFPTMAAHGQSSTRNRAHPHRSRERGELPQWNLNTDAHLRSVLLGPDLGEFGRVYFADFDQVRAGTRTVRVVVAT